MITLISAQNIADINAVATEILSYIKSNKVYSNTKYRGDERIKGGDCLIQVVRSLQIAQPCSYVSIDDDTLKGLVTTLYELLDERITYTGFKIKDYTNEAIKVKLCRELVSQLDDLMVEGLIDQSDIDDVYATLGKPVPKKFAVIKLDATGQAIYTKIKKAIGERSETIKVNSVTHYHDMVDAVDPNEELTKKEFIKALRKKVSDIGTLVNCVIYRFDNDKFQEAMNEEYDRLVIVAAYKINDYVNFDFEINDLSLGNKGFEIEADADGRSIYARAIPVEGNFVRFHYRYIIT